MITDSDGMYRLTGTCLVCPTGVFHSNGAIKDIHREVVLIDEVRLAVLTIKRPGARSVCHSFYRRCEN